MPTASLITSVRYLPKNIVNNEFFYSDAVDEDRINPMFQGVNTRRHVSEHETAGFMVTDAINQLVAQLNLDRVKDIEMIITNVTMSDLVLFGSGASIAKQAKLQPKFVYDIHSSGCVSYVSMLHLAKTFIESGQVKNAIICNVQNSAGQIFSQENTRKKPESRIPGDGCGISYICDSTQSPILSVVQTCHPAAADDMYPSTEDGRKVWQPGKGEARIDFNQKKIIKTLAAGNKIVPEAIKAACKAAGCTTQDIDYLITNQPSNIFLRNWHEAIQLPEENHIQSFKSLGNLFGAAHSINFSYLLEQDRLKPNDKIMFAGFSHAGDFSAAALVNWQSGV